MINVVLSLELLGRDEATTDKVAKGGLRMFSSQDSRRKKDAPSSHKLTSSSGELNLGPTSCDRSYSRKLFTKLLLIDCVYHAAKSCNVSRNVIRIRIIIMIRTMTNFMHGRSIIRDAGG